MADLKKEVSRRRTFAIISHPDAGKTTITEKILWHGGVIREAGEVKGKAGSKAAASDWMKLERERGISVTSSVMQFHYEGLRINLVDTPGHQDFGEDTYRTLMAVDSAAMLLDAAKGVEPQTRKLYEVCRLRRMPIFTFANKMDREGLSPFDLIDDVEDTLRISCFPVTWPIGIGATFKGLYHRLERKLLLYSRASNQVREMEVESWTDPAIAEVVGSSLFETLGEEMELLEGVLPPFEPERFQRGEISPMLFGSAKFNWGVDTLLRLFEQHAPSPQPRISSNGDVSPTDGSFSGFVFKIQANMDPRHRDRIAFIRVCSGEFRRGMKARHMRLGREVRLAYANQFMAQSRETLDVAYAGDIIGVGDPGNFQIGDTVSNGKGFRFLNIPRFSPENFARVTIQDALKKKQLLKGVRQLVDEGAIQMFCDPIVGWQNPILGVVGELQFDVLLYRLKDEYGLEARLERLPFSLARWPKTRQGQPIEGPLQGGVDLYQDLNGRPVVLLKRDWNLEWAQDKNPDVVFHITSGD